MNYTFEKITDAAVAWLEEFFPNLIGAVLILAVGMWFSGALARFVSRAMRRTKIGETVISFTQSFTKIAVQILVCVAALGTLGFNIASLITALGAATVAVGLALQDSLKNVASGIMILLTKPFEVGDFIDAGGLQGKVTRIDIASTHLLTADNKEIIMPNSNVSSSNIVNYYSQENRRVDLSFGVSYSADIDEVKRVVDEVIDGCGLILDDPERFIAIGEHKESCVEVIVRVWCKGEDYWVVYHYMQENVKKKFDESNIEIPYPQIDVHNS